MFEYIYNTVTDAACSAATEMGGMVGGMVGETCTAGSIADGSVEYEERSSKSDAMIGIVVPRAATAQSSAAAPQLIVDMGAELATVEYSEGFSAAVAAEPSPPREAVGGDDQVQSLQPRQPSRWRPPSSVLGPPQRSAGGARKASSLLCPMALLLADGGEVGADASVAQIPEHCSLRGGAAGPAAPCAGQGESAAEACPPSAQQTSCNIAASLVATDEGNPGPSGPGDDTRPMPAAAGAAQPAPLPPPPAAGRAEEEEDDEQAGVRVTQRAAKHSLLGSERICGADASKKGGLGDLSGVVQPAAPGFAGKDSNAALRLAERARATEATALSDPGLTMKGVLQRRSLKLKFLALETILELRGQSLKIMGEHQGGRRNLLAETTLTRGFRVERTSETRWRIHPPAGEKALAEKLGFELCAGDSDEADRWIAGLQQAGCG